MEIRERERELHLSAATVKEQDVLSGVIWRRELNGRRRKEGFILCGRFWQDNIWVADLIGWLEVRENKKGALKAFSPSAFSAAHKANKGETRLRETGEDIRHFSL